MGKSTLYPLQFIPQLKEKVWGGSGLASQLNKNGNGQVGESWEISGVTNHISVVAEGALQGMLLSTLIETYKEALVGRRVYERFGNKFPLLFKFIDAAQDLSVQLHPSDVLAQERHDSFGKTEMWYVLQAKPDARLILGFNNPMTKEIYTEALHSESLTDILHAEKVHSEEAFFIAPGTVHAIGAGVLLAEIQQTSDITYRIYDWNRPDTNGKLRQLHTEAALDAINFNAENGKIAYVDRSNKRVLLKKCPYFVTHKLVLTEDFTIQEFQTDSCKVYMCVAGTTSLISGNKTVVLEKGQTIMVPAYCSNYKFQTENATLLEVYIP